MAKKKAYNARHQKAYRERKKECMEMLDLENQYLRARVEQLEKELGEALCRENVAAPAAIAVFCEENRQLWAMLPRHLQAAWMSEYLRKAGAKP